MSRSTLCLIDSQELQSCTSKWVTLVQNTNDTQRKTSRLVSVINLWFERSRQRRELLEIADHPETLKDLGLSTYDLRREGRKPFWRK